MVKGKEAIEERLAEIKNKMFDYDIPAADRNRMQRILGPLEVSLEMYLRGYRFSNIDIYKSQASEFVSDPEDDKTIIPYNILVHPNLNPPIKSITPSVIIIEVPSDVLKYLEKILLTYCTRDFLLFINKKDVSAIC